MSNLVPSELAGVATGVGSLPHGDADAAVAFVAETAPLLPYLPQLPQRDERELMLAQLVAGHGAFAGLAPRGAREFLQRATPAPAACHGAWERFRDAAAGGSFPHARALKAQVVGPITAGRLLSHGRGIEDALATRVIAVGAHLSAGLRRLHPRAIIQIDEPAIGDGTAPELDRLRRVIAALHAVGAATMLHCCAVIGETTPLFDAGADIVSFDAILNPPRRALVERIARHRRAGGVVAWGLVPTGGGEGASAVEVWRQALGGLEGIVTPTCGLGLCGSVEAARAAMRQCARLAGSSDQPSSDSTSST